MDGDPRQQNAREGDRRWWARVRRLWSPGPKVTVIIPTYNWSTALRYAMHSVLWQTFTDFELLVIGDACTDDSAEVVASFGDPRVRWHNLERNSGSMAGPSSAGLRMARGRYVAYLGHDDVWYPTHLAVLVEALDRTRADLAYTHCVMMGPPGSGIRMETGASPSGRYEPGQSIPPETLMHRRAMARDIGGWRDYRTIPSPPDFEFVLRAHQRGKRFVEVNALTVFKFNATLRPNVYRERPCHEQAEYVRRIQSEPDFLERERRAIEEARAAGIPWAVPGMPEKIPHPLPPGWLVTQWRRIRGLEPPGSSGPAL